MPCVVKSNVFVPCINVKQPSAVSPSTNLPSVSQVYMLWCDKDLPDRRYLLGSYLLKIMSHKLIEYLMHLPVPYINVYKRHRLYP